MGEVYFRLLPFKINIMKKTFIIIAIFLTALYSAQKIDFNTINSNNVLTILNNITITENKDLQNYNKVSQMIQIGNSNAIEVYDNSKKSNLIMSQVGNYNTTFFNNQNENQKTDHQINVKGSNNHVDITGSNSISEGMIINLKQNDKMVFIRNY